MIKLKDLDSLFLLGRKCSPCPTLVQRPVRPKARCSGRRPPALRYAIEKFSQRSAGPCSRTTLHRS